jgi:hypothetical protein
MLNTPRNGIRSMLAQGTLAALLGMTLGCAGSPTGPTPAPATPAPVAPSDVYTVTASTTTVALGGQLSVSWTTSAAGHNDWISLFKKGDTNMGHSWWVGWTDGAPSGTLALSAPLEAGQYEFRYLLDDGYHDAATSRVVTVGGGAGPAYNRGP